MQRKGEASSQQRRSDEVERGIDGKESRQRMIGPKNGKRKDSHLRSVLVWSTFWRPLFFLLFVRSLLFLVLRFYWAFCFVCDCAPFLFKRSAAIRKDVVLVRHRLVGAPSLFAARKTQPPRLSRGFERLHNTAAHQRRLERGFPRSVFITKI